MTPVSANSLRRPRLRHLLFGVLVVLASLELAGGLGRPDLSPAQAAGPSPAAVPAQSGARAGATPGASGAILAAPLASSGDGISGPRPGGAPSSSPGLPAGLAAPSLPPIRPSLSTILASLDSRLAELRSTDGIPGMSAAVIFRDGLRWTGAAGLADVENGIQARPGTPFALASISKTFTAALVLRLIEEGRLSLDEPAAPHLAGVPGVAIDRRITIGQLLDHTSGLNDYLLNLKIEPLFAEAPDAIWSPAQDFAYLGKTVGAPGTKFSYSNANYMLLGLIAEQVTGQSIAAQLRSRFFDPLGLRTASYQSAEAPVLPIARAYKFDKDAPLDATPILMATGTDVVPFQAVVTAAGGAGSVAAAAPDVATWGRALYGGEVLRPSTVTAMVDDAARTHALNPLVDYGLGVQLVDVDGHPGYGHTGRYLGARGVVRYFPADGLTIAVLTNQSRADPSEILVELFRIAIQR